MFLNINFAARISSLTGEDGRKQRLQYDPSDGITDDDFKYHEWSTPINFIDNQAYIHDVKYYKAEHSGLSSDEIVKLKNEADRFMIDNLETYEPQNIYERVVKFFVIKILKVKAHFGMVIEILVSYFF